jgi:hypothetical protein
VANTLEVLSDILSWSGLPQDSKAKRLHLIAPLPAQDSKDAEFIRNSIDPNWVNLAGPFHHLHPNAASCVILQNKQNATRTIVSHDNLPPLTYNDFHERIGWVLDNSPVANNLWVHFEGRDSEFVLECIRGMRKREIEGYLRFTISIECENPARKGVQEAASHAILFFTPSCGLRYVY